MSKKTLLAKRVLTALALGSVLYAPVAMASGSIELSNYIDQTIEVAGTQEFTYDIGDNYSLVKTNIVKKAGASESIAKLVGGHFHFGDEDLGTKQYVLNVDKIIVGSGIQVFFDGWTPQGYIFGNNVKEVVIEKTGDTVELHHGAVFDGHVYAYTEDPKADTLSVSVSGEGYMFIEGDIILSDKKDNGKYVYTISSGIDILHRYANDPEDDCYDDTWDCSLQVNADQLTGTMPIRNAGNLILTGGRLTRDIVAGTYRHCDVRENPSEWITASRGEVYVTGGALTIAKGVEVQQVMYGGRGSSNNTLNLTLEKDSKVNQVIGGFNDDGGDANGNTLTISGSGTVLGDYISDGKGGYKYDDAVFGGWVYSNQAGTASNNTVTIAGVTVDEEVYGGAIWMDYDDEDSEDWNEQQKAEFVAAFNAYPGGTASNNKVIVKSGSIDEEIFGANIYKGTASGNSVTVESGTISHKAVYGANLGAGTATGNLVIVQSGEFSGNDTTEIYGAGFSYDFALPNTKNKAEENVVNIVGGTFAITPADKDEMNIIAGAGYQASDSDAGVTGAGTFSKNGVNISGGTFNFANGAKLLIVGAEGKADTVSENYVTVTGGTFTNDGGDFEIYGALAQNGKADSNSVSISNSSVVAKIYGGYADTGAVSGNSVNVTDSFVRGPLYGGYSQSGDVVENSLTLLNGKYVAGMNIQGQVRYAGGFTEGGKAGGNTVELGTDTSAPKFYDSAWVIGGASKDADDKSDGIVSGNNITIYNAEFNLVEDGEDVAQRYTHIVAGRGGDGDVTNNSLVIKDITLNAKIGEGDDYKNNVWGGFAQNEGNVSGNSITIEKGILNINLMAGGSSNFGDAINNTVTITGKDTVINGGTIFGGRCYQGEGEVSGNVVDISDATIKANVSGGWTSVENKAHDNKVFLNAVTVGSSAEETYSINASKDNKESKGGLVQVKSGGLLNKANLTLGGGKVKIDGAVTGTGNLTILSNTGEINASVTQTSLTLGKEGITTHTVTASMDNIHVTTLTNNGTFNVSGTLNQAINGNGTNKVLQNTILSLGSNASLNNLTLAGTLNLQNDAYTTTTITNLTTNTGAKVNFDAKFSAAGDQINATTASGTLALGSIGLKEDFDGDVGASKIYTLLTNGATDITLTGSSEAVMGAYKYVFTVGETAGTLKVTKDYGYTLQEIIQNSIAGDVAGKVGSYSLNGDKTMDGDMGTLTRVSGASSREFMLNGNGNKLLGNNHKGITVNSGDTLTYKDIAEVSGFNGAAVTNNGTFNANNVTFKNEVAGSGTMYIDGTVNADAKVSNKVNVKTGGVLNANANNIANIVDNAGIYNAEGGTVGYAVTGNGTMNIKADTQFGAKVSNNVVVEERKKLTVIDNLTVGSITLQNAVLDVNEGKVLTTNNLTLTGTSATVTMDKANVLNEDLSVKDGWGNIIVGTDGNLNLRFEGIGYTVNQYKSIKSGLFGQGENASLNLLGGNLQLEENQVLVVKGVTADDGKGNMTIGGAKPAVSTNGDEGVEVGAQANQTIVIARANQLGSLNSVAVNANSNIVAKDLKIENIDKDSFRLTVGGGSGDNSILELTGSEDGLIKDENGKEVAIDVTISSGSTFNIGNKDKGKGKNNGNGQLKTLVVGGDVNVYNMGLNIVTLTIGKGGCITFDPGYYAVGNLNFDDDGVVRVLTDGTVLNVDNMDVEKLKKAVEIAGMSVTEQTKGFTVADGHAVLALKNQLDLTGGTKHLVVDTAGTTATNALQLGAGAVLVAQKEEATADTPVVKLGSKEDASIADTAQLVISADKYQKDGGDFISYIVLDQGADEKWAEGNIYAADPTYKFTFENGKLVADWNKVEGIFGEGAISAPEMYNRILQKEQNTDANKFLKDVIKNNASAGSTAATKAAGAAALNAVTSLGELATVNHGLYTVSNQMTDAVANHMSLIDNEEAGRDIWAAYIHNKEDVEGLKLGGIDADYSAKYNGVVVGADLAKSDEGNVGVALSYVDGDISGASAGVRTRNDAEYYGASLYGRVDGKDISLLGDISYMHGKGDITQTAMGQEITADAKSDAISVGLRLEKAFKLGKVGRLMPYIGARYMSINTKDYHNSLGMNYDMDKQNLFMAPVGIAYSAYIEDNGWTYKPTFEAGYVFNMGDKNVDQKVSYNGYGDTFGMDVVDNGYWFGRVGFAAEKKHMAYSLGYQYMKSNNAKNSKYMVNVAWKF